MAEDKVRKDKISSKSKYKMSKSQLKFKKEKSKKSKKEKIRRSSSRVEFPKSWKEEIEKSGKLFEQEVASILQDAGFGYIIPNEAFLDVETGESRELDVFAIDAKQIGKKNYFIFPILLVAVKKINLVCFSREEIMSRYAIGDIHFSGMPKNIYLKEEEYELTEYLNIEKIHHFYKYKKISSQFWTPYEKAKEEKGDYFYRKLIFPLVKAVVANIREHEKSWYFDPTEETINLQIYYPIIVVENLWECSLTKRGPKYRPISRIGFVSRYSSKEISGEYLIDICDKNGFKGLLKIINQEVDKITSIIEKKVRIFENSALMDAKHRLEEEKK